MVRILHLTVALLVLVGAFVDLRASASTVLTAQHVAVALGEAGLKADPSEVEFPVSVPASNLDVPLRVRGWRKLDENTIWVRLTCQRPKDCLPFFILLHPAGPDRLPRRMDFSTPALPAASSQEPVLVRVGSQATLLLRNGTIRIKTPVTCLENGKLGATVRVKNLTTKRIYSAEVIARGIVRAWF